MTQDEVLAAFKETGALLEGHFELRSKLHSNRYFQCANVLRYPRVAARLCDALVGKLRETCDVGAVDGVISPAVGGILVGHEVARALDTKCVFAERSRAKAWMRPASRTRCSRCAVSRSSPASATWSPKT